MTTLKIEFAKKVPTNLLVELSEMMIDMLADKYSEEEYIPIIIYASKYKEEKYLDNNLQIMDYMEILDKYQKSLEISRKMNSEDRKIEKSEIKLDFVYPKDHGRLYPFDE